MSEGNGHATEELRLELLDLFGPKIEPVDGLGRPLHVRRLLAGEGMGLVELNDADILTLARRAACLCVCDAEGRRIFRDEDEANLSHQLAVVAGTAALKLNGLLGVQAIAGKSARTLAGSSPSG